MALAEYSTVPESTTTSFSTGDVHIVDNSVRYKCLVFYGLYTSNNGTFANFPQLSVDITYDGIVSSTHDINLEVSNAWTEYNIPIDNLEMYSAAAFNFTASKRGNTRNYITTLYIDDVEIRRSSCIMGLQDMEKCTFDSPQLCNYGSNCTFGSGYQWKRHIGPTSTPQTGPSTDADGNYNGNYIYVDSSLGDVGHISLLWFIVTLPLGSTTQYTYRFWYHMLGDGVGSLKTFYIDNNSSVGTEHAVPVYGQDIWVESDCYDLPVGFSGHIYFEATRGDTVYGDIALDNVMVLEGDCPVSSVSCEFDEDLCGYIPERGNWQLRGGYAISTQPGSLHAPLHTLDFPAGETTACLSFGFESEADLDMLIETETSVEGIEVVRFTNYAENASGQVEVTHDVTNRLSFVNPNREQVFLDFVAVMYGPCSSLSCLASEHTCSEQCIPAIRVCDRTRDCHDGSDEDNCGFDLSCDFTNVQEPKCGYQDTANSATTWTVQSSYSYINASNFTGTIAPVDGAMLITVFTEGTILTSSVESVPVSSSFTSCIRFMYVGNVQFLSAVVTYDDNSYHYRWLDNKVNTEAYTFKPAQIPVEPGVFRITFITSLTGYNADPRTKNAFVAIDNVTMTTGSCDSLPPLTCPSDAPNLCDDGSMCFSESAACDGTYDCLDNSDESVERCGRTYLVECDFEDVSVCGYNVRNPQYSYLNPNGYEWLRRTGYAHQTPQFDHTRQNESGHYVLFSTYSHSSSYRRANLVSPSETFEVDGCITFWYWLNSTATRPNALSSQIIVSLLYITGTEEIAWYDYADRTFDRWVQGGVPVLANQEVRLSIEGVVTEPIATVWPGSVAVDDIEFLPGPCLISQMCGEASFSCEDTGMCIPQTFVCDGTSHCNDNSDEQACSSRPSGELELAAGDGTYGELRYYSSVWKHVCYPSSSSEETFGYDTIQTVCSILGFNGNTNFYKIITTTLSSNGIQLYCSNGSCSGYSSYCSYGYVGVTCSDHACFSGERLCPGTSDVCVSEIYFCDGLPDCPNNADEQDCYCDVNNPEETTCSRHLGECKGITCQTCEEQNKFECITHECVDHSKRCDGVRDCRDGSDEYKCVLVDDKGVFTAHNGEMRQVCINDIDRTVAETMCNLAGKGLISRDGIQHGYEMISNGLHISPSQNGTLFPGVSVIGDIDCYPLLLHCQLPDCGSPAYMEDFISPMIIQGNLATIGEWPWQGILFLNGALQCGCSYLGEDWALTAAHCVESTYATYTVRFGTLEVLDLGPHGQEVGVNRIYSMPGYDPYEILNGNDLALLKLVTPPMIDNYTRPICLGNEESLQKIMDLGEDAECYITGFGRQEDYFRGDDSSNRKLAEARVSVVKRTICEQIYWQLASIPVSHDGLCLEHAAPFGPACNGDSGGPFVCKADNGHWKQFGVTSYGLRGCDHFSPDVYVNITGHADWIQSVTGISLT